MAKPDHQPEDKKESPPETDAWGTWEELLLAYAVKRFGTNSWDSISSELRKRSSAPILLTPHHCKRKYQELERRFEKSNFDNGGDTTTAIPWLHELRKLRVAELQRELQNFDEYIASLQLKMKKLTEESEKNSDLGHKNDDIELKNEEEVNNKPPEPVISGEEQLPGGQSMNGSNGNLEIGVEKSENESSPVGTGDEPVRVEDSCNDRLGLSEPVKTEPDGGASEAPESKSEGTMKENSDVQSSASKSRKEKSDRVRRGNSKADEDPSRDKIPVRSLPLVNIMQKVQKLGSAIFERRLDRQEKVRYKNLIRQHIDFETLQTRLKEGRYSDGNNKFFRDLLLVVNNTYVFFPDESPESVAAIELRKFILKELMSKRKQKTDSKLVEKQSSSKPSNLPPKRASEPPDSMLLKPKLAGPMIVCRKRSSITAKASGSSSGGDRRKEQTDVKNSEKLSEENETTTKRTRDAFPLNSKKNVKNIRANNALESHSNQEQGKASPSDNSDLKNDMKKKNKKAASEAEEKKQSAAKFLNRMKQSSSASNNEPLGVVAGGGSENDSRGGSANKGGDGKKDQVAKRSSGGRQRKEEGSPARTVGRPPKRGAAAPPMAGVLGKRNRESAESETSASKQTKKRSKR